MMPKRQGKVREFSVSWVKLDQKTIKLFHGAGLKTVVSRHSFIED